ncbi:MAG TPA: SRPBCC family protein [Candidatus Limnocylindrales bacterium]|nr:SRPBCC family protein [Candidatus Limnocylindrales bacterium]
MRSQLSVDIAAPAQRVFALARDVAAWPRLLPHYRGVHILGRRDGRVALRMSARRPLTREGRIGMPVAWRAEQWAEADDPADLRLRFRHTGGPTRGMEVTWHIRPQPGGCSVTIEHDFVRRLPLVGQDALPRLVDRLFVRPIAGRTLATFKALAEAET